MRYSLTPLGDSVENFGCAESYGRSADEGRGKGEQSRSSRETNLREWKVLECAWASRAVDRCREVCRDSEIDALRFERTNHRLRSFDHERESLDGLSTTSSESYPMRSSRDDGDE